MKPLFNYAALTIEKGSGLGGTASFSLCRSVLSLMTAPVHGQIKAYNPHFVRHRKTSVPFPVNTRRGPYRLVPVCEGDRW